MVEDRNVHHLRPGVAGEDGQLVSDREVTETFEQNEASLVSYLSHRLRSRTEAQDAAQAVFVRLWQRRETLHRGNLKAMMFVTARNHATDLLRRQQRERAAYPGIASELIADQIPAEEPSAERLVSARQELGLIASILKELPEKCRRSFIRYKFEDWSYADIAVELGVTESMVRKHVLRAMTHCAERFAELEGWN